MKKYFICMLSLLLVAGLSGIASAITDPGANYGPLDLTEATVEVYDRGDVEMLALTVTVTPDLPGVVILECDVDDSTGTGGTIGTIGAPVTPCPCKTEPGFDLAVTMYTRRQGDTSSSAFCASCTDGVGACERRRESGEWYAVASLAGQPQRAIGVLRGLLDPAPKTPTSTATKDTYVYPWSYIKAYVHEYTTGNPKQFNWTKASDPLNNKWQISIFYDPVYTDIDDVTNGGASFQINDFAPDAQFPAAGSKAPTTVQTNPCEGNLDGNTTVDGIDAGKFKTDFGRSKFSNPCPPYPGPITY